MGTSNMLAIANHRAYYYYFRFQGQKWDAEVMRGQVTILSLYVGPLNLYEVLTLEGMPMLWAHSLMSSWYVSFFGVHSTYLAIHNQNIGAQLQHNKGCIYTRCGLQFDLLMMSFESALYCGHFQLHIKLWPLNRIINMLAIPNHQEYCHLKFKNRSGDAILIKGKCKDPSFLCTSYRWFALSNLEWCSIIWTHNPISSWHVSFISEAPQIGDQILYIDVGLVFLHNTPLFPTQLMSFKTSTCMCQQPYSVWGDFWAL